MGSASERVEEDATESPCSSLQLRRRLTPREVGNCPWREEDAWFEAVGGEEDKEMGSCRDDLVVRSTTSARFLLIVTDCEICLFLRGLRQG